MYIARCTQKNSAAGIVATRNQSLKVLDERFVLPSSSKDFMMTLKVETRWKSLALCAIALSSSSQSMAQSHKLDSFSNSIVTSPRVGQSGTFIVKFSKDLSAIEKRSLEKIGAKVLGHLSLIGSYHVSVPEKNLAKFSKLPFVARVSADVNVKKTDEFSVENTFTDMAFDKYGVTGSGVTVAVLDSGVDPNEDLENPKSEKSRIVANANFVPSSTSASDLNGHGTHVAGIIAGNGEMSSGSKSYRTFYGIAREANIINVRVLDATGQSKVSTLISAIQWVVDNRAKHKIRVLNLSLGHSVGESYKTDPLCQAVEKAWKSGIVVVCAAGNDGRKLPLPIGNKADNEGYGTAYGSVSSPGNDPYVITVGSMKAINSDRKDDVASTFSGRGPSRLDLTLKPDIMAPGNKIISLRKPLSFLELTSPGNMVMPRDYIRNASILATSNYFKLSGTSMAAPVVSGAVALMLQQSPSLSPDTVKARLMMSADKWTAPSGEGDACTYGAGYLNVLNALKSNVVAAQSALSPSLSRDGLGNVTLDVDESIWGERALWGTNVTELRAVWGNRALWGTSTLSGNRALWGTSVWSDRALWGTNVLSIGIGPILLLGE